MEIVVIVLASIVNVISIRLLVPMVIIIIIIIIIMVVIWFVERLACKIILLQLVTWPRSGRGYFFGDLWINISQEIECLICDLVFVVCRPLLYLSCGQVPVSEPQWRPRFCKQRVWLWHVKIAKFKFFFLMKIDFWFRFRFEINPGSSLRESLNIGSAGASPGGAVSPALSF